MRVISTTCCAGDSVTPRTVNPKKPDKYPLLALGLILAVNPELAVFASVVDPPGDNPIRITKPMRQEVARPGVPLIVLELKNISRQGIVAFTLVADCAGSGEAEPQGHVYGIVLPIDRGTPQPFQANQAQEFFLHYFPCRAPAEREPFHPRFDFVLFADGSHWGGDTAGLGSWMQTTIQEAERRHEDHSLTIMSRALPNAADKRR